MWTVPDLAWHIIMAVLLMLWLGWSMLFAVQILEDATAAARTAATWLTDWFHRGRRRYTG